MDRTARSRVNLIHSENLRKRVNLRDRKKYFNMKLQRTQKYYCLVAAYCVSHPGKRKLLLIKIIKLIFSAQRNID